MKKLIFSIIIVIVALFLYGKYIEVNNFKINEYVINNENIPASFKELKIVHFSDLLYDSNTTEKELNKLVEEINTESADIIIFSGDLVKKDKKYNKDDYNLLKDCLSKIEASLFKFAVIGDNDKEHLDDYKDVLYEASFELLDNQNKLVFYKDVNPINIIGLTNLDNIDELLNTEINTSYNLVIIHKPDYLKELSDYNINTIVSGHSLGGIINIPFYGGLIKKDGANTYINDNYTLNNTEIFISNGLGTEKYNFRLFNTPSINVYRFENTPKES